MIISGGENISSLEVEESALPPSQGSWRPPWLLRPDEKWGEHRLAPSLRSSREKKAEESGNRGDCRLLPRDAWLGYKIRPRLSIFGPLPKTSTGKIQKFVLREQGEGALAAGKNSWKRRGFSIWSGKAAHRYRRLQRSRPVISPLTAGSQRPAPRLLLAARRVEALV